MQRITCFVAICLILASPALAWHDGGHKTVAAIAFRRLTADQQGKIATLLGRHPRFQEEFVDKMPDGFIDIAKKEWMFQQAAVFPDIARGYRGDLKATYHRPLWHFINQPEFLTPADRQALHPEDDLNLDLDPPETLPDTANVVQVIRAAKRMIADGGEEPATRALMLSWLMHTVGDIHQPLHSTMMFSRNLYPKGDRGGNAVPTIPQDDLHSLWDDFPGGRLTFQAIQRRAITLLHDPDNVGLGETAAQDLNEEAWMKENQKLVLSTVYDDREVMAGLRERETADNGNESDPIELSEDYLRAGAEAADKRVVQAGFRLGAILAAISDSL